LALGVTVVSKTRVQATWVQSSLSHTGFGVWDKLPLLASWFLISEQEIIADLSLKFKKGKFQKDLGFLKGDSSLNVWTC
jgi:hypothetical protein